MKKKLDKIDRIADWVAQSIINGTNRKASLEGLGEVRQLIAEILVEIDDRIVFRDEPEPCPRPYKKRASKERIIQACDHYLATGKSLKQCEREFGLGNDTLRATTALEYIQGPLAARTAQAKRRARAKKRKQKPILAIDGLPTARGVAAALGITKDQVDSLLEHTRNKGGTFPLPVGQRSTGSGIPRNVWDPEKIDAYKKINGK